MLIDGHMTFYISAMLLNSLRSTVNAKLEKSLLKSFRENIKFCFIKSNFKVWECEAPKSLTFLKFKIKPEKQTPKRHFCQKNLK